LQASPPEKALFKNNQANNNGSCVNTPGARYSEKASKMQMSGKSNSSKLQSLPDDSAERAFFELQDAKVNFF